MGCPTFVSTTSGLLTTEKDTKESRIDNQHTASSSADSAARTTQRQSSAITNSSCSMKATQTGVVACSHDTDKITGVDRTKDVQKTTSRKHYGSVFNERSKHYGCVFNERSKHYGCVFNERSKHYGSVFNERSKHFGSVFVCLQHPGDQIKKCKPDVKFLAGNSHVWCSYDVPRFPIISKYPVFGLPPVIKN